MTNRWEVVAGAFSSDSANAAARAAEWYVDRERSYRSFEEMAEAERQRADGVDAVMVTTPNHLHFPASKAFLNSGINVICDKPLTNSSADCDELARQVDKTGMVFGVCYTMSCYPMIRQAREIIASGVIGRINQIHVEFMQDWMIPDNAEDQPHVKWRLDPKIAGPTSCVGDIGTHAAHLAQFVSGLRMTDLRADFHVCGAPKALEDTAFMTVRYEGGVPGTLMVSRLAPGNRGGLRLRIFGSEGGIEWDMEKCDNLKLAIFGQPDQQLSRGMGTVCLPRPKDLSARLVAFPKD